MKEFIFNFKHFFQISDENIYSKSFRRGMMFTALVLPILILLSVGQVWGVTHTLTEEMGETIYPTTFTPDAVPGDTIIIDANRTSVIACRDFDGTAANPYTFTNPSNAKVTITGSGTWGIQFYDSDNFKILGNNYSSETYGIEIDGSVNNKSGIRFWRCADWEVGYLHIHDTYAGLTQNNNDPWTESDSMGDCRVHHVLIEDTDAYYSEGMYFGKSITGDHPQWNTLEIDNCNIYRTGCDGIQAGQSVVLKIHDNYLEDIGLNYALTPNHAFGIIVSAEGGGAEIYNNKVIRARHNGIEITYSAGLGGCSIHDNVVWEAGYGVTANGIKINTNSGTPTAINNTIVGSSGYGIKVESTGTDGELRYNLLVSNGSGGISSSYTTMNDNRIVSHISTECFKDADVGDTSLTENSPARDAGQGGGYSTIDHDGAMRPLAETGADIGAYEFRSPTFSTPPKLKIP